ncbi:MAG: gamma-glutamyltransferase [Deltaproteobacteria bacterium]|nr:gamma-glutamyltransferase [Deltaproteobacteria bacterium]
MQTRFHFALLVCLMCASCKEQAPPPAPATPPPAAEAPLPQPKPWYASGKNAAVSTGKREATDAALQVMKAGGNAADGAAAALLALSVADGKKFHFGGEMVVLVYSAADNSVEVIAGQGAAPRLATRAFYAKKGIPAQGALAATVPGAPDAIFTLLDRHGTKTFKEVAAPTQELLKKGTENWHWRLATTLRKLSDAEKQAEGARRLGLVRVADEFYRGRIARDIDKWAQSTGALLRFEDLATHSTRIEQPIFAEYRGYKVFKPGAFTQGPALLAALGMVERFAMNGLSPTNPRAVHVAAEAMKLAFADRDLYLGDPRFASVPTEELFYPYYLSLRAQLISLDKALNEMRPGDPLNKKPTIDKLPPWATKFAKSNDTTTCVVADKAGNVVAATASGWSGVEAGETGVWLGSRLQSFNLWPDHPNTLEPGKRPRITLTPTLVMKNNRPVFAISVAGGDVQDQVTLQLLMDLIDFRLLPDEAVTAPRWATEQLVGSFLQTAPRLGVVKVDLKLKEAAGAQLVTWGHKVEVDEVPKGEPSLLVIDPTFKILTAAGDPAAGRTAAAF